MYFLRSQSATPAVVDIKAAKKAAEAAKKPATTSSADKTGGLSGVGEDLQAPPMSDVMAESFKKVTTTKPATTTTTTKSAQTTKPTASKATASAIVAPMAFNDSTGFR